MYRLLLMFVLVQLALLARYIVFDAFDQAVYASTYLFLVAAVGIHFLSKHFAEKERNYVPKEIADWSFLNKQRVATNEKPLFKGSVPRGSIQRTYATKKQYILGDILGPSFFIGFTLKLDEDTYTVHPMPGKLIALQNYWTIEKNGVQIGAAKTVADLKNSAKLKEVIETEFDDTTYTTAATTVTSQITLHEGAATIGHMKRSHLVSNVNVLSVQDDIPEQLITLLIHAFQFKNA